MAKIFSCLHHDSDSLEGQATVQVTDGYKYKDLEQV